MYAAEGDYNMARTRHYSTLKFVGGNSWVKQIPTNCISGFPGDTCKHMLKKIVGGGQGKRKYPASKCRACKKRGEMH
jgi:hypothetical protein